jgi:parallel beta-helix repeat protein
MHRQSSVQLFASALVVATISVSPAVNAAAQRTFVASYGLMAHTAFNCSIAKPCRAFSEAIGVTNPGGEVIVLDSAGYGPVTVTKSVSIIAPQGIYGGITVFSGDGVKINAGASDIVVLRGLSINGQGGSRGIFFQAGARLRVEDCIVSGMSVAGISHNAAGGEMVVLDTIVRDTGGSGIVVVGDLPSVVLEHVRSEHGGGDGFSFAPTAGSLGARATIVDSMFTHNEGKGIGAGTLVGATITIVVERSVMSYNGQDGFAATAAAGSARVTLTRNAINDNGGHGIWLQGNAGNAIGAASENAVHRNSGAGIFADNAGLFLSANTAQFNLGFADLACQGGVMATLGNNSTVSVFSDGTCYFAGSGT